MDEAKNEKKPRRESPTRGSRKSQSDMPQAQDATPGELQRKPRVVPLDRPILVVSDDDHLDEKSEELGEEGVSLEELSETYAHLLQSQSGPESEQDTATADDQVEDDPFEQADDSAQDISSVSPLSILEAILMVGRPDSGAISAAEIARVMRGVDEHEIAGLIAELNKTYAENNSAFTVAEEGIGYRLRLADDLRHVSDRFYGQVREVRLNQAAVDCLALVSYQPGISREELEKQRGKPSGSVLNQLVRRQLLEMRREGPDKKLSPHYYPTDRLLQLAGLDSLEDLPQVEEWE